THGLKLFALAALVAAYLFPLPGARSAPAEDTPLPERPVAIEVDMQERATYRLAIPDVVGGEGARTVTEVMRHDLRVSGEVSVVPEGSLPRGDEGLEVRRKLWTDAGVQGVIKGALKTQGDEHTLE